MNTLVFNDSPFKTLISFHKLIESLEEIALSDIDYRSNYAKAVLKEIEPIPEFRTGIADLSIIEKNKTLIKYLLADLFPTSLTNNEIKAVTIPFQNLTFNYSERFKKILNAAGDFDLTIRDFSDDQFYVLSCILILNSYYRQQFDYNKPLFYDIPNSDGIINHYRILYNADFIEIYPTEKAVLLSSEDIDELMDNYSNIDLWKEKFPLESWVLKGFGIVTLYDATKESAISNLKSNLLKPEKGQNDINKNSDAIFKSIFKVPDLRIGLVIYNEEEGKFIRPPFKNEEVESFILLDENEIPCEKAFLGCSFSTLLEDKKPFSISNVEHFSTIPGNEKFAKHLLAQGIKSCILAPVIKDNKLLGIMELVSSKPRQLNSINANNLDLILPYIVDTMERYNMDLENQVEAIIQREYTAIHSSVYWKFRNEAQKYFQTNTSNKDYIFKEIVFKEVYPLYGQIDIKGSSEHRNATVKEDLKNQLNVLSAIFENLEANSTLPLLEQRKFEMQSYAKELQLELKADTEQQIQNYIQKEIHPILSNSKIEGECQLLINSYFEDLDPKTGLFYQARKKFDDAMSIINKKMATVLDKEQVEAQNIFPHYFERFKTDGVEHNLYIGASIAPSKPFDLMYLNNLRLWQLQTLCKMELEHHQLKSALPYELDVTSLILVFSSPISIRFRMDEKRFDVDGTYNARYEVVKKRIDKSNIKGTTERITQKEKITIVYSHNYEETEYLKYIKFLQFKGILEPTIEQFDVEELQGVSGLKALRVKVSNTVDKNSPDKRYTYQELLDELN
ncbi:GAF domain-containing protein [Flavobacterium gillisiae]|uniref:GAF domain-containing protein n=1 Tax=Flavobacterium gillisiae TaxID=150146 RepID=A0A1H4BBU5_9FLAO|nr:GAF domain-containing protein [Flavobacterium gillisiae]SEA45685.1 GAF domain-containing protein [Flavobacterium gillisiae]